MESGEVEVQVRRGRAAAPGLPWGNDPGAMVAAVDELCRTLP
jgi:hypothetical protein